MTSTLLRLAVGVRGEVSLHARLAALVACGVLGGAGCTVEVGSQDEPIGQEHQAIGGNWRVFVQTPNQTNGFTGDAAACNAHNNQGAWAAIGRASNNRYRWSIFERLQPATAWADLGTATFNTSPTCAPLDELYELPQSQWNYQKAILGRNSSNNRYYIRIMKIPPGASGPGGNPLPTVPSVVQDWQAISTSTWTSAPAATVAGDALILCGRRSGNTLYCQYNALSVSNTSNPYNNSNWSSAAQAPALPSPWAPQGDPVITNTFPWLGTVTIALRATRTNPSQTRIYYTQWSGSSFSPWLQFPTGSLGIAASDPALETHPTAGATLVFRGTDNKMYEGTGLGSTGWSFSAINAAASSNSGWSESPAAAGGLNGWEGGHVVLAKKNGQFFYSNPCPIQGSC